MQLSRFLTFRAEHCFFCCRIYNKGDLPIATSLQLVNQLVHHWWSLHVSFKHGAPNETPWVFASYMFHKLLWEPAQWFFFRFSTHIRLTWRCELCWGWVRSTLVVVALCLDVPCALCQGMPTRVQRDLDRSRRNLGMFWETPPRMLCNRGNEGLGWIFKPKNVVILLVTGRTSGVKKV